MACVTRWIPGDSGIPRNPYGYPIDQAARVALATAIEFLKEHGRPALVRFVLFDAGAYGAFAAALEELV